LVKGSSGVAISRGAYLYLRNACNSMVTWSGQHLALPARFPDYEQQRVVCPYRFVEFYNVCTFGYTTGFWNWERWERELDWMALHGVTMPLAMMGQEVIWDRVWKSVGMTRAELDRFSTGPAQLPWHRMGNLNYFDGPLPEGWTDQKRLLQKKILSRIVELGMSPIVPGFAGHVPEAFKRIYPKARIFTQMWGGEPALSITFLLGPSEGNVYKEIGRRFIQEYKNEYGVGQYYLADSFNEMRVPVTRAHRYEELAEYGRTIYDGILAGDPNGIWVMQGWLFFSDPRFWDPESIKAFLSQVPNERMLIIQYTGDLTRNAEAAAPVWERSHAFYGKQWMNGMIHTFGGNNNVQGNLRLIASQPAEVLASPPKGNLVGWSMCPEGTENNEVVFELMTDMGWSQRKIDLRDWIAVYCKARYGGFPPAMNEAWNLLLQSAYNEEPGGSKHSWQRRPSLNPEPVDVNSGPAFRRAVEQFISCAGQLQSSELYRNDLIEFVAQAVGGSIDRHLAEACQAHKSGHADVQDRKARESLEMLLRIDAIMSLRKDRLLVTWCDDARSWARVPGEAVFYDCDARLLITYWGWPGVSDYAARVWAGLIRDYYVGRWRTFFRGLGENEPASNVSASLDIWQQTWLSFLYVPSAPQPVANLVAEAHKMLDTCKVWE
jgi:alpha-N-acetylglucosaminidase